MAKKSLAYTLNLLRKSRTHPVFYVGFLKPYRVPSHVNLEALAPKEVAVPRIAASPSRYPLPLQTGLNLLQGSHPVLKPTLGVPSARDDVALRA